MTIAAVVMAISFGLARRRRRSEVGVRLAGHPGGLSALAHGLATS
jgi:hypothetical protein